MAVAHVFNGWLAYRRLDFGPDLDGAFAIGYRLLDDSADQWTRRFSRFKSGQRGSWNAAWAVLGEAAPVLVDALGFQGSDVTFAPALSSSETAASPTGVLSVIAQRCAGRCGSEFLPELLTKRSHVRLHGQSRSVQARSSILQNAEYSAGTVNTPDIFVLDDLITAGSTLSTIASAIKSSTAGVKVYGLALAKNERLMWLPEGIQRLPNGHIPREWENLWHKYDKG